jgi:hypothetical protein
MNCGQAISGTLSKIAPHGPAAGDPKATEDIVTPVPVAP